MASPFAVIIWVSNFLRLIKATITGVSYDNIKNIKSIFSNETEKPKTQELQIKAEPTYCIKEATTDEEDYDNGNNYDISDTKCDIAIQKTNIEDHIPPNINISTKIQNNNTTSHNPQRPT